MGKVILHLNVTPDGFCDHRSAIADAVMMQSVNTLLDSVDRAFFGRTTFQLFENYWPSVLKNKKGSAEDIIFAGKMENIEKIVFSKTLTDSGWKNTRFQNGLNKQAILEIKKQGGDIIVFGSPVIAGQLIDLDLVDDFYFLVQPFVSGAGPHMFSGEKLQNRKNLQFKNAQTFKSGTVILNYSFAHV